MTLIFEMSVKSWVKSYYANLRRVHNVWSLCSSFSHDFFLGKLKSAVETSRYESANNWSNLFGQCCKLQYRVGQCDLACIFLSATRPKLHTMNGQSIAEKIIKMLYLLSQLKWFLWSWGKCLFLYLFLLIFLIMLQLICVFSFFELAFLMQIWKPSTRLKAF